ncbi:MAG: Eco57I restriction-modification methylase domain-containing protein [Prevotella sp.]|nr:Eco57I restriction-modification methylase domain-containing protein [Prevotella sp.]MBR2230180.1 Eco57I restriction-modification methylase domain-containing protein [Prevotella sp.]
MPEKESGLPCIDIREDDLSDISQEVLATLLRDHTTGKNIFWATHDYEALGSEYDYHAQILPELITGEHGMVIRPRVLKSKESQTDRVKDMAEVFTPSWVVKKMVDYVDININTLCLEITCGEAPFLVSRYDTTTGEPIAINERIGILDRKLRMVNVQKLSDEDWIARVKQAFQSTYGYEWQGDSLLLARENLLYTFIDYYEARYNCTPDATLLKEFAEIISWNLWQMDGLTYQIPREKSEEQPQAQLSFFDEAPTEAPAPLCKIMDWQKGISIKVNDIKKRQTKNIDIMKFDVIIGNPPYQEESVGDQKTMQPPVYHYFIEEAYKLSDIVELIHPARFLFDAGATPHSWNIKMLNDTHLKAIWYEENCKNVFPNQDIKAGIVCTYHNTKKNYGPIEIFTKYAELNTIIHKVKNREGFSSMSSIVVSRTAYRFTDVMHKEHPEAEALLSRGHAYDVSTNIFERLPHIFYSVKPVDGYDYIGIYGRTENDRAVMYVRRDFIKHVSNLDSYKLFLPKASGTGIFGEAITVPVIGEKAVGNTETFISVGNFKDRTQAERCKLYICSKFARTLLNVLKTTQDITPQKWSYVPLQDFTSSSDIDWSKSIAEIDEQLFDKYGLDEPERNFIRTKVKEMA